MLRRCEICGREFRAQRRTARFCSATCRKRKERGYAFSGELEPPAPMAVMSQDDALSLVTRAHDVAEDLSRAALMTPAPLCHSLGRVAGALEEALRGERL